MDINNKITITITTTTTATATSIIINNKNSNKKTTARKKFLVNSSLSVQNVFQSSILSDHVDQVRGLILLFGLEVVRHKAADFIQFPVFGEN